MGNWMVPRRALGAHRFLFGGDAGAALSRCPGTSSRMVMPGAHPSGGRCCQGLQVQEPHPVGSISTSGLSPLNCTEPQRVWRALAPAGGCEEVPLCPRICSFIPNVLLDQALSLVALLCCFAPASGILWRRKTLSEIS